MKKIKTIKPVTLMEKLSVMVEESMDMDDEDFFYDRVHFIKQNYDNDEEVYKSGKVKDKVQVLEYGLETITILINQILRFNRVVYSTKDGTVYNFPKGQVPKFQIDDIFSKYKTNSLKQNNRTKTI
tara:strand:+ start:19 stop:396 length:378 start_codon:yes stop_codon:yes gene_type:complete